MSGTELCYMCEGVAVTKEHAPPKCLFPKSADLGQNFRVNLITVPSCRQHNTEKSRDDEYFRALILAASAHANLVASNHFLGALLRGAKRSPSVYKKLFHESGNVKGGAFKVLKLERQRFDNVVDHMVRALYYHLTGNRWKFPFDVVSPNFFSGVINGELKEHEPTKEVVDVTRKYLGDEIILGENPEIFKYRIKYDAELGSCAFAGIFYDFFEVYCYSIPDVD